MKRLLLDNIDKIHTTKLGQVRIKRNLKLQDADVIEYCINKIKDSSSTVSKNGKNFYIDIDNVIITINSYSLTIITAHLKNNERRKKYVI